ncbi:MAG: hypothetical protein DLM69_04075 [Candidatus Chloroheliales bacterium]|nr:MAG: hypothetical protein DLM69_04075 [Chloroflexota bacterium]
MKLPRISIIITLVLLVSLSACNVISDSTPTVPRGNTSPTAGNTPPTASPTTLAMAATPTSAAAAAIPTTTNNIAVAPTSTAVAFDLPTVTAAPPTAGPLPAASDTPTSAANSTATIGSATPSAGSGSELIFYLGDDSIYTIKPDGSNRQLVTKVSKGANQDVSAMSASADGKHLAYELVDNTTDEAEYYLVNNGKPSRLDGVASLPVWYGHRFLSTGQPGANDEPGEILVFNADSAGGPAGAGLGVMGSNPAWYPDGAKVVYSDKDDNIYSVGANPPPTGKLNPDLIIKLNDKPAGDNEDFFGVMFVAVTPDGKTLVFGGEQLKNVGASGNGQRLWMYDLNKGLGKTLNDVQPFTDFGGRYGGSNNYGFVNQNTIVVASDFHISACAVGSAIDVLGIGNDITATVPLPGQQGDTYAGLYGLSVAPGNPNHSSPTFAYSFDNYTCDNADAGQTITQAPAVYVWSNSQNNKVADGRYPIWVDSSNKP